jgi:hypothetical protein
MPKKTERSTPTTAGELRRLIAEKGLNWTVDPRLRDEDRLRRYARGGQEPHDDAAQPKVVHDLPRLLRSQPPVNPFLRARWIELKLLSEDERGLTPGSPSAPPVPHKEEK